MKITDIQLEHNYLLSFDLQSNIGSCSVLVGKVRVGSMCVPHIDLQ